MTNFRLIFWWFCQGVSPVKTKNRTARRLPDFVFYGRGATAVFGYDPTREKRIQKSPQAFLNPK